jgi:hypothetical protein
MSDHHTKAPAPARSFKTATAMKPNKTIRKHVQLKDTKIKTYG